MPPAVVAAYGAITMAEDASTNPKSYLIANEQFCTPDPAEEKWRGTVVLRRGRGRSEEIRPGVSAETNWLSWTFVWRWLTLSPSATQSVTMTEARTSSLCKVHQ